MDARSPMVSTRRLLRLVNITSYLSVLSTIPPEWDSNIDSRYLMQCNEQSLYASNLEI